MSRREKLITFQVAFTLVFAAWAFGGMVNWARDGIYGLVIIGFLMLFLPMGSELHCREKSTTAKENFIALTKFPVFWLGLLLLIYILIGYFNPSMTFVHNGKIWWVEELNNPNYKPWLPTSVRAPEFYGNPTVYLRHFGMGLLFACTCWVGVKEIKGVIQITNLFLAGFLIQILFTQWILFQRNEKLMGVYEWIHSSKFTSFFYENHSVAYLYTSLGISLLLASYYVRKSNVFVICYMCIGVLGYFLAMKTHSHGGKIIASGLIAIGFFYVFFKYFNRLGKGILILIFFLLIGVMGWAYSAKNIQESISLKWEKITRIEVYELTTHYALKKPLLGYGADSFALHFPEMRRSDYFKYMRPIYPRTNLVSPVIGMPGVYGRTWMNTHSDPIQYFFELGIIGSVILSLIVLFLLFQNCLKRSFYSIIILGAILCHSCVDFIFVNPAILLFFIGILTLPLFFEKVNSKS